jgi:DNA-binding response OmpR family regulator
MTPAEAQELIKGLPFGLRMRRTALYFAQHLDQWVSTEQLIVATYSGLDEPEDAKACIKAMTNELRKRLGPHGLTIEGRAYLGRRMAWDSLTQQMFEHLTRLPKQFTRSD